MCSNEAQLVRTQLLITDIAFAAEPFYFEQCSLSHFLEFPAHELVI